MSDYAREVGEILLADLGPLTVNEYGVLADAAREIMVRRMVDQGMDRNAAEACVLITDDMFAFEATLLEHH